MRSGIGGWVANMRARAFGRSGSAIHRCAIEVFAFFSGRPNSASFPSAEARPSGSRVVIALVASARYSRCREIAACTAPASRGATMRGDDAEDQEEQLRLAVAAAATAPEERECACIRSARMPTATTSPNTMSDTRMS